MAPTTVLETKASGFPSRFSGQKCATCSGIIYKGDMIRWSRKTKGVVWHEACYETRPQTTETASTSFDEIAASQQDIQEDSPFTASERKSEVLINTPHVAPKSDNGLAQTLANALSQYLPNGTVDEKQVIDLIKRNTLDADEITELVKAYAPVPKTIQVEVKTAETGEVKNMGLQHHKLPLMIQTLSARQSNGYRLNVWLTGPAGSGKTTAASACATALGLPYYFTGALDNPYGLLGFTDANGKTVRTPFREAYETGGVFLFDEIDACSPNAVLAFNAALANGHCAFPDGIIARHKDFVCVAAANTWGLGATNDYVGRMKQDAAFNDRFVQLNWDIDENLETETCGNPTWAKHVQSVRSKVKALGIKVVVSPRASYFGAGLLACGMSQSDVEAMTLRKAMTDEQWASVSGGR